MTLNLDMLEQRAQVLTHAWALESLDILFQGERYAHLETVLHEAAHAASLKLPFDAKTSGAVSSAIYDLNGFSTETSEAALNEEAKAWAIEWELLQRLGLDHVYTWATAVEGAAEQGVDKDRLLEFVGAPMATVGADTVMGWLEAMLADAPAC